MIIVLLYNVVGSYAELFLCTQDSFVDSGAI